MTTQLATNLNPTAVDWTRFTEVFVFMRDETGLSEPVIVGSGSALEFDTEGDRFFVSGPDAVPPFSTRWVLGILALRYVDSDPVDNLEEIVLWVGPRTDPRLTALLAIAKLEDFLCLPRLRKQLAALVSRKLPCER